MGKKKTKRSKLAAAVKEVQKSLQFDRPFWKGPEEDGITQSLLCLFLVCRERFRVKVVEGWESTPRFNKPIEYGNMWHLCEEQYAADKDWGKALLVYCRELAKRHQTQQQDVERCYQLCKLQFPIYLKYWGNHAHVKNSILIAEEQNFSVPYKLPSGRVVKLRGKWDLVDKVKQGRGYVTYLQENKTKGDIDEQMVMSRLMFDIQTGIYLTALDTAMRDKQSDMHARLNGSPYKLAGVRYNVVRRPLSGGRGTIRPHKATSKKEAETSKHFYGRVSDIIEAEPEYYFMRWDVKVLPSDLERFQREFLIPCLESLCEWWDWVSSPTGLDDPFDRRNHGIHWRQPYGVWSPLQNNRPTDLDEYVATGSTSGLSRIGSLFRELEG